MKGFYKYYLIIASEMIYGGSHGIFDVDVVKCSSFKEAQECGIQMSRDVIDKYNTLEDCSYETEEELENWYNENIDYAIYEVDLDRVGNMSHDEMRDEAYESWREFRDKYCQECDEEWSST